MRRISDDLGGFVGGEGIWKIPKPPLHVLSECAPALVRNGDEAFSNVHGIHRAIVVDHHRLLGRLGVEDPHGDLLDLGNHFEASAGAFGLHLIADNLYHFAFTYHFKNLLTDKDLIVFEVDVAPR